MFNVLCIFTLLLVAVSGSVIPRATRPPTYAEGYLEDYTQYHTRYLALGCQYQHGKKFFDQCCHPMLATERLETARPPQCAPSAAAAASASAAEPTSTVVTPVSADDGDCDDDPESTTSTSTTTTATPAAKTPAAPAITPAVTPAAKTKATPTPKPEVTPTPTPKPVANAAPDPAAAASTTSSTSTTSTSSSSTTAPKPDATPSTETFTGSGTFFYQNGVAGACGSVHKDSDAVVALDTRLYGDTGVASPFCGKQVKITNVKNQKSVFATVADACPTCNSRESVDMSVGAFTQIADEATGEVTINWNFVS